MRKVKVGSFCHTWLRSGHFAHTCKSDEVLDYSLQGSGGGGGGGRGVYKMDVDLWDCLGRVKFIS